MGTREILEECLPIMLDPELPSATNHFPLQRPGCVGSFSKTLKSKQQTLSGFVEKRIKPKQKAAINRDLMDLFVLDFQPFSMVEDDGFRRFIEKWITGYKLPSRKTISSVMIPSLYHQCVQKTRKLVQEEASTICLTCDSWTSKANESYLAVTGHYISPEFEMKSVLLACTKFSESHTAVNIGKEIKNIIGNWGLISKVNFAVSDNAANMVAAFENELKIKHYGCYAHSLNLIVQQALELEDVQKVLEKVKSVVTHFKRSTQAHEKLLKYQTSNGISSPLSLIQDVVTRWNSTFNMVKRFVHLEDAVRATVAVLNKQFPEITLSDWRFLKEAIQILQPFEEMTTKMSGEKYSTGSSVIVVTRTLKLTCERLAELELTDLTRRVLEHLKNGVDSRFTGVENSSTFALCTLLDPRYKDRVFKHSSTMKKAKKNLESAVAFIIESNSLNNQQTVDVTEPRLHQEDVSPSKGVVSALQILNELVGDVGPTEGTPTSRAIVEVDNYLSDDFLPCLNAQKQPNDPLVWWKNNQGRYPNLAALVRQKCNILATSVPCERVFSKSGMLISEKRTRLTSKKVEMVMFLNGNYQLYKSLQIDTDVGE